MSTPERPQPLPDVGTLFVDVTRDRIGEYRGVWAGRWALRPIKGGVEWDVDPKDVRALTPEQRLHAEVSKANARSRGEIA